MKTYHSDVRCGAKIGNWVATFAVAALVLCWMSAAAVALSIPVTASDGTPMGTIDVEVSPDGTGIVGGFNAIPSLAAAAAANNEDHFNWHQVVVSDNNPPNDADGNPLVPPYNDPPAGGYGPPSTQWADDLPWYWDEGDDPAPTTPGWDDGYNLDDNTTENSLGFTDFPWDAPGTNLEFNTWLVSLNADGSLHSYHGGFAWTWSRPAVGADAVAAAGRNIFPPGLFGQVPAIIGPIPPPMPRPGDADLSGFTDSTDFSIMLAAYGLPGSYDWGDGDFDGSTDGLSEVNSTDFSIMLTEYGLLTPWPAAASSSAVPEPSTLAGMLGLCLAGLLASRRRKR